MLTMRSRDVDAIFGAPIGVGGFTPARRRAVPGVGGLFDGGGSDPTFTGLASTRQAIESLNLDMQHALATLSPADAAYPKLTTIFVEYDEFTQEFEGWYAVASQPTLPGSAEAMKSLPNYQQRYREFRARYVAMGGKPTQNLVTDDHPSTDWGFIVKWGLIGAAVIVIAPTLLGPAAAALALAGR